MNRRILTAVLILVSLSFIVSPCYAWNTLPIARIVDPIPQYICVGDAADFDGVGSAPAQTGSYDPDNGTPYGGGKGIDIYGWWYGYGNWDLSSGGTPSHTYDTAGAYSVELHVYDDDGGWRSQYSDSCMVYVVEVASVTVNKTIAAVNETVTFTAHANPAGKPLDCIEWQKRYRPDSTANWEAWESASGGDNTAQLNTSTAGVYQYRARNGSGDTWKESPEVTVVEVVEVYEGVWDVDFNEGPVYVCSGETVHLWAEPYPGDWENWPDGEPTWDIYDQPFGADATITVDPDYADEVDISDLTLPGNYVIEAYCGDSSADITITVVEVDKLQYNDPDTGYTDISGTLYVHTGTIVTFKAIQNPSGAYWPSGKPVWGGTAGASGTGSRKAVTFNTLSSSTSDYKTVTAECGNTVTANVIVFDFNGVLTPNDGFYDRSLSHYGVEETVGLSHTTNPTGIPSLPLEWKVHSGVGSVIVEESKYDAGAIPGDVTLKLELQSGPSKGDYKSYDKTVDAPTYRFARHRTQTGIYHIYQQHGIKFKGEYFVDPKNVSFTNIEVREGISTPAVGTGYFEPVDGDVHTPGSWLAPLFPNTTWGCWWAVDTSGFEGTSSDTIGQSGTFTNYYIDIEYRGDDNVERGMGTIESLMTVDTDGYSLIKKGSVGWVPVFFSAPTTNPTW